MSTTKRSVVASGGAFRIYNGGVEVFDDLPLGTYRVVFDPMSGHFLTRLEDTTKSSEKMYGNHQARIDRMVRAYRLSHRSLGVLLSGPGGMGKTMMTRALMVDLAADAGLPIVRVESASPGLAAFLDTLGECIVVFDEFEKNFRTDHPEQGDVQAPLLTLFDGTSQTKRLYIVTVNELFKLNGYMVNRTGRFHYHLRFDYPQAEQIIEYLTDHGVDAEQADKVAQFASGTRLNYDHLRSIAFELAEVGGTFDEVIGDLNIKHLEIPTMKYSLAFENIQVNGSVKCDPFGSDDVSFMGHLTDSESTYFQAAFSTQMMKLSSGGGFEIPGDKVTITYPYCDNDAEREAATKFSGQPVTLRLQLKEDRRIDF